MPVLSANIRAFNSKAESLKLHNLYFGSSSKTPHAGQSLTQARLRSPEGGRGGSLRVLLAGAGGHCRTPPDLQPGLYRSRRQQVSLDGPGEGDTMQGPGCQQGRGQQGAKTLSREDVREPPRRIRLLTKHTLGDEMTKNLKTAVTER